MVSKTSKVEASWISVMTPTSKVPVETVHRASNSTIRVLIGELLGMVGEMAIVKPLEVLLKFKAPLPPTVWLCCVFL